MMSLVMYLIWGLRIVWMVLQRWIRPIKMLGFGLSGERDDNRRYTAVCAVESCDWRIHASRLFTMLAGQLRFQLIVKKRLLYKVMSMAKEKLHGGWAEAYELLPRYVEMIKQTNPGSYALITWGTRFLRGCRPIIGIDGDHLSGFYNLLTIVDIDGNNEIFVLAYRIVDTERCDSWTYFMRCLRKMFEQEGCNKNDWTFISDRMKGVELVVRETFPRATRRVCCQHLYMKCKNNGFSGSAFHKLFWIAADAYNEYVFGKATVKITEHNPQALLDSCIEQWSRHKFDSTVCCNHNTTNFVESFNACTKTFRDMSVFSLLEAIRSWCV
ncbi:uncharacterized protein [Spinacia oleracea]|uniref:MULE transposase domain-containing protein n=1 Tax=Spinacia oleracea TaxID=3562 RepID=A0ABM3R9G9_SPIOL|nr:uncharacterized protein LOC130467698 [Spinacia oleracea]